MAQSEDDPPTDVSVSDANEETGSPAPTEDAVMPAPAEDAAAYEIATIGPARALTVTFLIPLFGVLWGFLFLDEPIATNTLSGCALIVGATATELSVKFTPVIFVALTLTLWLGGLNV